MLKTNKVFKVCHISEQWNIINLKHTEGLQKKPYVG